MFLIENLKFLTGKRSVINDILAWRQEMPIRGKCVQKLIFFANNGEALLKIMTDASHIWLCLLMLMGFWEEHVTLSKCVFLQDANKIGCYCEYVNAAIM